MTEQTTPTAPTTPAPERRDSTSDLGRAANQANAVMGIYGISGTGKSNLADTAAEYCYETYGKLTLCYVADLGGFGTKRLTLIRHGIMRVYDPRNHVNPFETMELIAQGAFPLTLTDPERGYAEPDVPLILPRRFVYEMRCPSGHAVGRFESQAVMNAKAAAGLLPCPTCGLVTTLANAQGVDRVVVRHRMFKDVGLRIYDSGTALNEWAMSDLQDQSARGTLPSGSGGGSLLGAADALVSGQFKFGSSSVSQYGFVQNRTYGWLSHIKKIPDQVLPAIMTFHVEQSKGDESTGGDMLYGPKIAGNARTGAMGGWLGNLIHTTIEPFAPDDPRLVYRMWLRNHIDPRDPRKIPYIAKQRGLPTMPDYLEDKPGEPAWTGFSLKVFFTLMREQLAAAEKAAAEQYPQAPGMWAGDVVAGDADEAVSQQTLGGGGGVGASSAPRAATGGGGGVSLPVGASSGRVRRAGGPVAGSPAPAPPPAPGPAPSTGVGAVVAAPPAVAVAVVAAAAAGLAAPPAPALPPAPSAQSSQPSRSPLRRVARPPV